MLDDSIALAELVKSLRRNARQVTYIMVGTTLLFALSVFVIPAKYKSTAVVTIRSGYFQTPLVRDFFPDVTDNAELKSQRENLIRGVFQKDFLNEIGESFGIFKSAKDDSRRSLEQAELYKRIEIVPMDISTFSISFTGKTAKETYGILEKILSHTLKSLALERTQSMSRLRDSIRRRVEALAMTFENGTDPLASSRPELLRQELARINAEITALKSQYSDRHPAVTKLQARAMLLRGWIQKQDPNARVAEGEKHPPLVGGDPKDPTMYVYTDLLKKLNYLNVVLDMEGGETSAFVVVQQAPQMPAKPVFPRMSIFIFWGLLAGMIFSLITLLLKKYFQESRPRPEEFAKFSKIEFFGSIPMVDWASQKPQQGNIHPKAKGASLDGWQ